MKIGEQLRKVNLDPSFKTRLKDYLLQVWDRKGRMVYERQLDIPVRNWGIFKNILVFQEEDKPSHIFLLKLRQDMPATLFKFKIHSKILKSMQTQVEKVKGLDKEDASSIAHFMICYTKENLLIGSDKKIIYMNTQETLIQYEKEEFYG